MPVRVTTTGTAPHRAGAPPAAHPTPRLAGGEAGREIRRTWSAPGGRCHRAVGAVARRSASVVAGDAAVSRQPARVDRPPGRGLVAGRAAAEVLFLQPADLCLAPARAHGSGP